MSPKKWEKVKEIFDSLRDVPDSERFEVLRTLDGETRRALEELLADFDGTKSGAGLLDSPPIPQGYVVSSVISRLRVFEPGQLVVGRFEVLKGLGRGGMGEVYEAFDRVLGERIAIKTVRFDLCFEPEIVERFKREVQRSRRVTHPNVCRVYDLFSFTGSDGLEVSFMTMELIDGQTLSNYESESGMLPEAEAKDIAFQLCQGLAAAHEAGIIHRDFKSSNVLLSTQGGITRAVITDFGLARLMTPSANTLALIKGRLEGTLAYLAPELLSGQPATRQSDIYALGVVLFRMVTGCYPFITNVDDLEGAIRERQNPPRLRECEPDVDESWDAAIQACLASNPADRADSVLTIGKLLTGSDRPSRTGVAVRKLGRRLRRRDLVIGGGTAAAALVLAELFHLPKFASPLHFADHTKTLIEDFGSSSSVALGRAVRNLLRAALAHSTKISVIPIGDVQKALEDLQVGMPPVRGEIARAIAQNLKAGLMLAGDIVAVGTGYRLTVSASEPVSGKKFGVAEDSVSMARDLPTLVQHVALRLGLVDGDQKAALQIEGTPLDEANTDHADALEMLAAGVERYQNGDFSVARDYLEEATKIDNKFAIAYAYLGELHGSLRRWDLGFEPTVRAYNLRQTVSSRQRHYIEAMFYIETGDWENAREAYRVITRLYPNDAEAHRNLAQCWLIELHPDLALQECQEALRLDPKSTLNHLMLVTAYADLGKFSDAARAVEQAEQTFPGETLLLDAKGYIRLLQNDAAGALNYYSQLAKSATSLDNQWMGRAFETRALLMGGQIEKASSKLERELDLIKLRGDQAHEDLYHYWASELCLIMDKRPRADEHIVALARREAIPPNLFPLRAAAELAWRNRDLETLRSTHKKLKSIADKNPSTRSKGIFALCDGLLASLEGRSANALTQLAQAHTFWPDIASGAILAEVLSNHGDAQGALGFYRKVLDAKWNALQFECVLLWIRSAAMTGHVLKELGQYRQAVSCFDMFLSLWGANKSLPFVNQVIQTRNDCLGKNI
ncbi:MAG TPA: protein kinase [Bryobacteraceae bacterium]|nr:protein kinase [Bryobacteraceae bacterium]